MTMVEIRKAILNALREACKASIVDQSMQLELNACLLYTSDAADD